MDAAEGSSVFGLSPQAVMEGRSVFVLSPHAFMEGSSVFGPLTAGFNGGGLAEKERSKGGAAGGVPGARPLPVGVLHQQVAHPADGR